MSENGARKSGRSSGGGISRRQLIKSGAVVGATALYAPMVARGLTRGAKAAEKGTIRMLFTAPTFTPADNWALFETETGLKMEATVIKDDPGLFLSEIMINDGGDRYDIFSALAGSERTLAGDGFILPIDGSQMSNWSGVSPSLRDMDYLNFDDQHWGTVLATNADSFGYFPEKLGLPKPPEQVSWSTIFENPDAMGRTSMGDSYVYLHEVLAYGKIKGYFPVDDPANPTPDEANAAADWLIERKKAGQFRNFWSTFDDQVTDIKNGEVLALVCWEPAVRAAKEAGLNFEYANAEFYFKWMHGCYIPAQVEDRGNFEEVYTALNWLQSGSYASQITPLRGYVNGRPDLGKKYAAEKGLDASVTAALDEAVAKIEQKFSADLFWYNAVPDHIKDIQSAMGRVLSA